MELLALTDADIERIEELSTGPGANALLERLAPDQREAVRARVIDELPYDEIASAAAAVDPPQRRADRGAAVHERGQGRLVDGRIATRPFIDFREVPEGISG